MFKTSASAFGMFPVHFQNLMNSSLVYILSISQNFTKIYPRRFELFCCQTDKQTGSKHYPATDRQRVDRLTCGCRCHGRASCQAWRPGEMVATVPAATPRRPSGRCSWCRCHADLLGAGRSSPWAAVAPRRCAVVARRPRRAAPSASSASSGVRSFLSRRPTSPT